MVEDDDDIRSLLVQTVEPELLTLDVQWPGLDGLEICRRLREHSSAHVVMISARSTEADQLAGLDAGGFRMLRRTSPWPMRWTRGWVPR